MKKHIKHLLFEPINFWALAALVIAAFVLLPIISVLWIAFHPSENIWPHLLATTLPRYLGNTAMLMLGVGVITSLVGTGAAWLIVMYRFPFSRVVEWALLFPLAIPAYIGAYALVDFLEYAGPVQTGLRHFFGWTNAQDYWFPEIRSQGAAVLVLSAALYPYVYLMVRAAFRELSGGTYEIARVLGAGPVALFLRLGFPLARPAIVAGTAIALMETVNDYGVVDYFAVQTLTTGIFSIWLDSRNAGGAAQIAVVILGVILCLLLLEKIGRKRARVHNVARPQHPVQKQDLPTGWGIIALMACLIPITVGFCLPVGVMLHHALENIHIWTDSDLLLPLRNTLFVGGSAAFLTVFAALLLVYGVHLAQHRLPRLLLPVTTIGYAAPGAVLAVGILFPLAAFDHALADWREYLGTQKAGLLLTGSAYVIIYAYFVRFFAIAQGATDAAIGRVSPSLSMAARSLGRSRGQTLRAVYLPLIRGSVGTALLLVFVDCVKELPATLLLRPFNFQTLATSVHEKASLENLGEASPAALLVILVGLVAVMLLARASK